MNNEAMKDFIIEVLNDVETHTDADGWESFKTVEAIVKYSKRYMIVERPQEDDE